jgi:hypothetical protein
MNQICTTLTLGCHQGIEMTLRRHIMVLSIWVGLSLSLFAEEGRITLTDVSRQCGVTFRHSDGNHGKQYLVEAVSAGVALVDYDGDSDLDIYFVNGAELAKAPGLAKAGGGPPPQNALFRNDGNWKFTDVTVSAGVGDTGFGLGVAAADYDNDGDQDIYVSNYGPNVLYRNNGNSTFTEVAKSAGVDNGNRVGAGVAFLDADGDGDLDLYLANYIQFSPDKQVPRTTAGFLMYPSPHDFEPETDTFYRNNGDGTFSDESVEAGIAAHSAYGMGVVAADYDDDGDTDIFVSNDAVENFLFTNDGTGKFSEDAWLAGVAFNGQGSDNGSMGVDCGDYNNDGRLDFFMTDFAEELPVLYKNTGEGLFDDATLISGAGAGSLPHVNWGTGFVDFDNDGDLDLFIACGHLQNHIEEINDRRFYHARNILLMNNGQEKFVNVSESGGDGMEVKLSSRGTAFGDLDNDGDVDAVVVNSRQAPTLLRNDSPGDRHWIQIRLRGTKGNRDGVGARVRVVTGETTQTAEVHSGRGYQSHHGMRLHFGLGTHNSIDRIEVRWSDGSVGVVENPTVDQLREIHEK